MPFISINITGLEESIAGLESAASGMSRVNTAILQQASEFMANELRRNAHVITGNLRNSVTVKSVTDKQAVVAVSASYAIYENARKGGPQGPHDFATRSEDALRTALPNMIQTNIGDHFTRTIKKPFKYTHKTIGSTGATVYHYSGGARRRSISRPRVDSSD